MKPVLIYIDEEPKARSLYTRRLQKAVGAEVVVTAIAPIDDLQGMLIELGKKIGIASIVIDQNLFANGSAKYVGTELATELRLQDQIIPIYILTNDASTIDPDTAAIEYVLSKNSFSDAERSAAIGSRIKRHINIFNQTIGERETRFEELLRKKYQSDLSNDELEEFSKLQYGRERSDLVISTVANEKLNKNIQDAEKIIKEIQERLSKRD